MWKDLKLLHSIYQMMNASWEIVVLRWLCLKMFLRQSKSSNLMLFFSLTAIYVCIAAGMLFAHYLLLCFEVSSATDWSRFKHILLPISEACISKEQQELVDFESFFTHTICHECCHGIGPHSIVLSDGRKSTVRLVSLRFSILCTLSCTNSCILTSSGMSQIETTHCSRLKSNGY